MKCAQDLYYWCITSCLCLQLVDKYILKVLNCTGLWLYNPPVLADFLLMLWIQSVTNCVTQWSICGKFQKKEIQLRQMWVSVSLCLCVSRWRSYIGQHLLAASVFTLVVAHFLVWMWAPADFLVHWILPSLDDIIYIIMWKWSIRHCHISIKLVSFLFFTLSFSIDQHYSSTTELQEEVSYDRCFTVHTF